MIIYQLTWHTLYPENECVNADQQQSMIAMNAHHRQILHVTENIRKCLFFLYLKRQQDTKIFTISDDDHHL